MNGIELSGKELLLIGYGSGDASEAMAAEVVPGWQTAAAKTHIADVLAAPIDLDQQQYEALHDGRDPAGLREPAFSGYVVDRVGIETAADYQDAGIEYYRHVESGARA